MKLLLFSLTLILLSGCKTTTDMDGIVIKNGIVLTMNASHDVIENGAVIIKGSRIIGVGAVDTLRHYPGFKILDADGGIIMPGLINTHSHLPMVACPA
jgi:cytosine/adenosine deaminase-related metal-dependent hydrolase